MTNKRISPLPEWVCVGAEYERKTGGWYRAACAAFDRTTSRWMITLVLIAKDGERDLRAVGCEQSFSVPLLQLKRQFLVRIETYRPPSLMGRTRLLNPRILRRKSMVGA